MMVLKFEQVGQNPAPMTYSIIDKVNTSRQSVEDSALIIASCFPEFIQKLYHINLCQEVGQPSLHGAMSVPPLIRCFGVRSPHAKVIQGASLKSRAGKSKVKWSWSPPK